MTGNELNMVTNNKQFQRHSIRLKNYDYTSDGAYFLTICSHNRTSIFAQVAGETTDLSLYGEIVEEEWKQTAKLRPNIDLDAYIVMPNHFHGIIVIHNESLEVGAQRAAPLHKKHGITPNNVASKSLGAIVRAFKSAVTRRINLLRKTPSAPVWQRNYWERIIRDSKELDDTRLYIALNPLRWKEDDLYWEDKN